MTKTFRALAVSLLFVLSSALLSACGILERFISLTETDPPETSEESTAARKDKKNVLKTAAVGEWLIDRSSEEYRNYFIGFELKEDGTGVYGSWEEDLPLTWKVEKNALVLNVAYMPEMPSKMSMTYDAASDTLTKEFKTDTGTERQVFLRADKARSYNGLASLSAEEQEILKSLTDWKEGGTYDFRKNGFGENSFSIEADILTINGIQHEYYVEKEIFESDTKYILYTKPIDKEFYQITISETRSIRDYADDIFYHFASLYKQTMTTSGMGLMDEDISPFICTSELDWVMLTEDNWKDYFILTRELTADDSGKLSYEYVWNMGSDDFQILDLELEMNVEASGYQNSFMILDQKTGELYRTAYNGISSFNEETSKTESVHLYSFSFPPERSKPAALNTASSIYSKKVLGDLVIQGIAYPTKLNFSDVSGCIIVKGKIDTDAAAAKWAAAAAAEEKLAAGTEEGTRLLYDGATAIDENGCGVRAFYETTTENGVKIYYRLHYSVPERQFTDVELIYRMPKSAYSLEDYEGHQITDMTVFNKYSLITSYARLNTVDGGETFDLIYDFYKPTNTYLLTILQEVHLNFYTLTYDATMEAYKAQGLVTEVDATTFEPLQ